MSCAGREHRTLGSRNGMVKENPFRERRGVSRERETLNEKKKGLMGVISFVRIRRRNAQK